MLVTQSTRPPRVAGAREATVTRRVAIALNADASLTRLAARFHPVTQPLSAAKQSPRTQSFRLQPGSQVLELPVDVEVTEAAMEAGAVPTS